VNTTRLEYSVIVVKPIKCILEISEGVCVMELSLDYIAKVIKSMDCAYHLGRYVTLKSRQIYLHKKHQFSDNTYEQVNIPSLVLLNHRLSTVQSACPGEIVVTQQMAW
jgi:hypothetical protein